ncbi:MAG: 30S ribosomal protein S6, partial [Chloroflexi bacterium]|nr:30S ribosomal protein S6 [Chloroflexota bacterium]
SHGKEHEDTVRRYELMLVIRPDVADDRSQAVLEKSTRTITSAGGQILKVSPWGRRRLAYPIGAYREGSYHIVLFEAPPEVVVELEHGLNITEEVMRHLVTRLEHPSGPRRADDADDLDVADVPPPPDDEPEIVGEFIDESESEAAPAAID